MINLRWLLAIPVMLAAALSRRQRRRRPRPYATAEGCSAKRRSRKPRRVLDKVEHASGIPIVIETIDAIPGLEAKRPARNSDAARSICLRESATKAIRDEGIYLLISKRDHVISHVLVRERLADVLPIGKRDAIRDAFVEEFKNEGGL